MGSIRRPPSPHRGDGGAIAAEWALAFPAVALVLAFVLGGISVIVDHGRLQHAAADGQRIHSFGGSLADIERNVVAVLNTSDIQVSVHDGPAPHTSCVTVVRPETGWVGSLLALPRQGRSCGLVVPQ